MYLGCTTTPFVDLVTGLLSFVFLIFLSIWTIPKLNISCLRNRKMNTSSNRKKKRNSQFKVDPRTKFWIIAFLVITIIGFILRVINDIYCLIPRNDSNLNTIIELTYYFRHIWSITSLLGGICVVIIAILRLEITFYNSIYAIGNRIRVTMTALWVLLMLSVVITIVAVMLNFISFGKEKVSDITIEYLVSVSVLIYFVIYSAISIIVLKMFVSRLNKLTITLARSRKNVLRLEKVNVNVENNRISKIKVNDINDINDINENIENNDKNNNNNDNNNQEKKNDMKITEDCRNSLASLNEGQLQLLRLSSKFAWLTVVAVISTALNFIVLGILYFVLRRDTGNEAYRILGSMMLQLWTIDSIVNAYCLVLQFAFASRVYYKFCTFCDSRFQLCFAGLIGQKLGFHHRPAALGVKLKHDQAQEMAVNTAEVSKVNDSTDL